MPVKDEPHKQFIILLIGDININHLYLKSFRYNITVVNKHDDILLHIETTQFDLILFDLAESSYGRITWQSELITRIKDPLCINNKTPIIAVINPEEGSQIEKQCLIEFDEWLIKPITKELLNRTTERWQAKALGYTQIILSKTKNNQRLALTIFEKLFEELPLQITGIKDALGNNQFDLAKEITHKLNGSVSFCGLMDIQQSANYLESNLLNNNYANIHQQFMILQRSVLTFTRHQKAILANLDQY
jgi:HPt (histidine-containing phosphotransfer) domain-containing protein